MEIELNDLNIDILSYRALSKIPNDYIKYVKISEYPCSIRDLSFSIKNFSQSSKLENLIGQFHHELLKEVFIFDYYKNDKMNEIKIAFRFIFQSRYKTIKDNEVNAVVNDIVKLTSSLNDVSIPGYQGEY